MEAIVANTDTLALLARLRSERHRIFTNIAAEVARQESVPIISDGSNPDVQFGPLPKACPRTAEPISGGKYPDTFRDLLNDMPYVDSDIKVTFNGVRQGDYGVMSENYFVIPAGWCTPEGRREAWRCKALVLRQLLLPPYKGLYNTTSPFPFFRFRANTRETIVDGLALFLHVLYKADGDDVHAYQALRTVLDRIGGAAKTIDGVSYELEAHGWLHQGFTHTSEDGVRHYLTELHFKRWLLHSSASPHDDLVGMMNLFERTLNGNDRHRECMAGIGMEVTSDERKLLLNFPAPWDGTAMLVAEAIDRSVSRKRVDHIAACAIDHVRNALATDNGQEMVRRLLSPYDGPHDNVESGALAAG